MTSLAKQLSLKPQDLLVSLKIAVMRPDDITYAHLASELYLASSEVHAAVKRAQISRLLIRQPEGIVAARASLLEFVIHGVKYAFPVTHGTLVRGMPTGFAGPPLKKYFASEVEIPQVWPDAEGTVRGIAFLPIYPTVPAACKQDTALYELLTLVDALRGGAARERELAKDELMRRLK